MSANEAAERLHVPGTMHHDQHGNVIEDYHSCGCQPPERSAGAVPIDAEVLAQMWSAFGEKEDPHHRWCDGAGGDDHRFDPDMWAEQFAAEYVRLSEGTDR